MRVCLLLLLLCLPLGADELSDLRQACQNEKDPARLKSLSLKAWELGEQLCVPYAEMPLITALNRVGPQDRVELLLALARHYIETAEPEKAAKCYRDAGRPYDPDFWAVKQGPPFRSDPRVDKAESRETLQKAVQDWEEIKAQFKTTAFSYPGYTDALRALAETGDQQAATKYADFQYPRLNRLLCYSSAESRLELVRNLHLVELLAPFGATPDLARAVLRSKGLAIDTLLEDTRKGFLNDGKPLLDKVRAATTPRERALAEMELAAYNNVGWGRKALEADPEGIRYYLKDAALAEFIRFGDHYGVLVVTANDTKWFDLGPAAALETQVKDYMQAIRGGRNLQPVLEAGYQAWVQPWIGVAGSRTLILSPDGALNFVSFPSLVGPQGRFLAEDKTSAWSAPPATSPGPTRAVTAPASCSWATPTSSASPPRPRPACAEAPTSATWASPPFPGPVRRSRSSPKAFPPPSRASSCWAPRPPKPSSRSASTATPPSCTWPPTASSSPNSPAAPTRPSA